MIPTTWRKAYAVVIYYSRYVFQRFLFCIRLNVSVHCLQTYRHIFTSPSSALKNTPGAGRTKSGQAKINGLVSVTPRTIAYAALHVRPTFHFSSLFSNDCFRVRYAGSYVQKMTGVSTTASLLSKSFSMFLSSCLKPIRTTSGVKTRSHGGICMHLNSDHFVGAHRSPAPSGKYLQLRRPQTQ